MKDTYNQEIIVKPSSAAMEPCMWLGIKDPKITIFENEKMGKNMTIAVPPTWQVDNLMHLNKAKAKELIDKLQHFIDTAE